MSQFVEVSIAGVLWCVEVESVSIEISVTEYQFIKTGDRRDQPSPDEDPQPRIDSCAQGQHPDAPEVRRIMKTSTSAASRCWRKTSTSTAAPSQGGGREHCSDNQAFTTDNEVPCHPRGPDNIQFQPACLPAGTTA